jgi:hypothetical protein
MAGCFLDVAQWNSGVERSSDERVPQRVRPDALGDPRLSGNSTHDPTGGMTVESLTSAVDEDRALETLTDREVERPGDPRRERHRDDLAALAGHRQGPVTSFQSERVDVRTESFGLLERMQLTAIPALEPSALPGLLSVDVRRRHRAEHHHPRAARGTDARPRRDAVELPG